VVSRRYCGVGRGNVGHGPGAGMRPGASRDLRRCGSREGRSAASRQVTIGTGLEELVASGLGAGRSRVVLGAKNAVS